MERVILGTMTHPSLGTDLTSEGKRNRLHLGSPPNQGTEALKGNTEDDSSRDNIIMYKDNGPDNIPKSSGQYSQNT